MKGALPVGFATGALTGFYGVGGGFLIVPALAVLLGLGFAEAIGTSLAVIALTSAAALVAHLASGSIDWPITASFTAAAVIGASPGHAHQIASRRASFDSDSQLCLLESPRSCSPRTQAQSSNSTRTLRV